MLRIPTTRDGEEDPGVPLFQGGKKSKDPWSMRLVCRPARETWNNFVFICRGRPGFSLGVIQGKVRLFRPQIRLGTVPSSSQSWEPFVPLPIPRETAETLWPLCLYYLHKSFPTSLIETVPFYEDPKKISRHIYQLGIKI